MQKSLLHKQTNWGQQAGLQEPISKPNSDLILWLSDSPQLGKGGRLLPSLCSSHEGLAEQIILIIQHTQI